jgi:hypothetical protein
MGVIREEKEGNARKKGLVMLRELNLNSAAVGC